MHALLNAVSTNRILKRVLPILPGNTYLVGGCIRDLLLGDEPFDFDLVTFGSAMGLAHRIGGVLGGKAFLIDRDRGVARIVINHGEYTLDISPARGADIEGDLRERDITINAMACLPTEGGLIDPLQGQADLKGKVIRLIGEKNLLDDPLRGLRCLRFAVQLGFSMEEHTERLIRSHANTLSGVAAERIKHEFLRALSGPRGTEFFFLLHEAGYARVLFGQAKTETSRALSPETVQHADAVLRNAEQLLPGVGLHFSNELEQGMSRAVAFRLAAFLFSGQGECPPDRKASRLPMTRLALATRSSRTISGTIEGACRVVALAKKPGPTGSEMYRVLSDHDGHIPEMLLLALAAGTVEEKRIPDSIGKVCRDIWQFFLDRYRSQKAGPLLSGHDILRMPGIKPGAVVGKLLLQIEEARADGRISSRSEALSYLHERIRP